MLTLSWVLAAWGAYELTHQGVGVPDRTLVLATLIQLIFGMLILSATVPTVLAEERVRGSLDVLLSTPLSTSAIVVGKWLGACRSVLVLALLPLFTAIIMAGSLPDTPSWLVNHPDGSFLPLTLGDRIVAVGFCAADYLFSCALLVSLGLLIATRVPTLGRAVALSVIVYLLIGIGWMIVAERLFTNPLLFSLRSDLDSRYRWLRLCAMSVSPVFGPINPIEVLQQLSDASRVPSSEISRVPIWIGIGIVILTKAIVAGVVLWLTIKTFDRCMGRASEPWSPRVRESSVREKLLPIAIL